MKTKRRFLTIFLMLSCILYACLSCQSGIRKEEKVYKARQQSPEELEMLQMKALEDLFFSMKKIRPVPVTADFGNYLAATVAKDNNDYASAATYYQSAYNQDKENTELLENLFLTSLLSGQIETAVESSIELKKRQDKKISEFLIDLVLISNEVRQEKWTEALFTHLKSKKDEIPILDSVIYAWISAGMNNEKEALGALDTLQNADETQSFIYWLHRALILDYLGKPAAAEQAFDRLLMYPSVRSLWTVSLMYQFYERNGLLIRKVDFLKVYQQTLSESFLARDILLSNSKNERVDSPKKALSLIFFDLSSSFTEDSPDTALMLVRLSEWLNPDSSLLKFYIGGILEQMGQWKEANKLYDSVPMGSNIYMSLQLKKSMNLIDNGQAAGAVKTLHLLNENYPNIPLINMTLGNAYLEAKKYKEAIESYKKTISLLPYRDASVGLLYFSKAISYHALEDDLNAENALKNALALDSENPTILNYLGYMWLEDGKNIDQAFGLIKKASEYLPNDGAILDSLGYAYLLKGDYNSSLKVLQKAISKLPQDPFVNSHLGDVYWQMGRKREARFQWNHALDLTGEDSQDLKDSLTKKISNGLSFNNK